MDSRIKRSLYATGVFLLFITILFILVVIYDRPVAIDQKSNNVEIHFSANHNIIIPYIKPCITVTWYVEGIKEVYLNGEGVIGSGKETNCLTTDSPQELRVIFRDASVKVFTLPHLFVPNSLMALAGIVLGFVICIVLYDPKPDEIPNKFFETVQARLEPYTRIMFLILSLILAITTMASRAITAFGTSKVLNWDETYYASTTVTAAHGLGFYPYVLGYPPIPDMGGMGYVLILYVLAYKVLGANILALRLVSFVASLIAVVGLYVLTRKWYGSAAGLAALALMPSLLSFQLSNTIRLDVFAIALVAWGLVLYAHVVEQSGSIRWHVLVGFVFALGLEVHLHTVAAAFAVGLAYLIDTIGILRRDKTRARLFKNSLTGFLAGYTTGVLVFVVLNIMPYPEGFFRTAALARLSAADSPTSLNLTAQMDVPKLLETFFSPAIIIPKEIDRYIDMFDQMSLWETVLWIVALPAFFVLRQTPSDFKARVLLGSALLGGGIVFNNSSPLYFSTILPFFVPPLATFITHGFSSKPTVRWNNIHFISVILMLVLVVSILPTTILRSSQEISRFGQPGYVEDPPQVVKLIKSTTSRDCIIAGPTHFYAPYFMDYPKFIGTRLIEVMIGSTYYGLQQQVTTYWYNKRPDIVFGSLDVDLDRYITEAKYIQLAHNVWQKSGNLSDGCFISAK